MTLNMYDWSKFWNEYPKQARERDFFKQVGKTVGGVSITNEQFHKIISSVKKHLEITKEDRILDLCCGNGLITKELAKESDFVLGIDFSGSLIETANRYNSLNNIKYMQGDVLRLSDLLSSYKGYFNKILCYEALAFFNKKDFDELIRNILVISVDSPVMFFGSILDRERIWNFFNTLRRKITYLFRIKLLRKEVGLGRWWKFSDIETICNKHNLSAEIINQDDMLHTSHYRFDVKVKKCY